MKVKATRRGFDNVKMREIGEVFDFPGKKCPSWCEQLAEPKPAKKTAPKQKPAPAKDKPVEEKSE